MGESHGKSLGVVIDGCPAGVKISEKDIQIEMDRRKPGQSKYTTQRKEPDKINILSGVFEGKTTGTPISMLINNTDAISKSYNSFMTFIDQDMQILVTMQSMELETTEAVEDHQIERQ